MADDFVLNVRQISQYAKVDATGALDRLVLQRGGIGGPYRSIEATDLVGTALQNGGSLHLAPDNVIAWNGAALGFGFIEAFNRSLFEFTEPVLVPSLNALSEVTVDGQPLATFAYVAEQIALPKVDSFNGRTGIVQLNDADILRAGGVLQWNPTFAGVVTVPTLWNPEQKDDSAASTAWVQNAICHWLMSSPLVQSFNGRTGPVTLAATDVAAALNADPFQARAPTPPPSDASTRIANTEFVDLAVDAAKQQVIIQIDGDVQAVLDFLQLTYAPLASPQLTGIPQAPTAGVGTATGQIATTAFVMQAVADSVAGVTSWNTRTGNVVFTAQDLSDVGGAFLASPIFTGTPSGPTAAPGTSSTQFATTAYVQQALSAAPGGVSSFNTRTGAITLTLADVTGVGGAPISNAALTGTPTAPTPPLGDSSTRLATTAWVINEVGAISAGVVTFNGRAGAVTLQAADISGAGGAVLAGPAFTGIPTAPTAVPGTNTQQLATTAFVTAAMGAAQGVSSFNNRTGAVTLALADITAAGGAPLASPVFTGAPAAPTASPGTATVQIATTAFVNQALTGFLNSPVLTGTPTAPTAGVGTATTQLATTAFVAAALAAMPTGGVASFNGRTGAVSLTFADVSAVGGAPLASPALTGTPTAPTAPPNTSTTQLATTAFVMAALGGGGVVSSFNGRVGTVTLSLADVTATTVLDNTALTGVPTAPTAPANTNTTQIASTAFVESEIAAKAGGSGVRTLLQTQTVTTAVAYVNFPNVFSAAYEHYEIDILQLAVAVSGNDQLAFQITNNGTVWQTTQIYSYSLNGSAGASTNGYFMPMSSGLPAVGYNANTTLRFWQPWLTTTTINKQMSAQGVAYYSSGTFSFTGGCSFIQTNSPPVVGVRFFMAGGNNIGRGIFRLYGISA